MKQQNKGFSIVELLIAVAILGIVSVTVLSMVNSGMVSYTRNNNNMSLQQKAQMAMNQIQETVMDATNGVNYYINTTVVDNDTFAPTSEAVSSKKMVVYNEEGRDASRRLTCTEIRWDESEKRVYFSEYELKKVTLPDGSEKYQQQTAPDLDENSVLAENVTKFEADLSRYKKDKVVEVEMSFQVKDQSFHAKKTINMRNPIKINADLDKVFEGVEIVTAASVTAVDITPKDGYVDAGGTYNELKASVSGEGYPSQTVRWEITNDPDDLSPGTKIASNNGSLTVDANEESKVISLKATSVLSETLAEKGEGEVCYAVASVRVRRVSKDNPIKIQSISYVNNRLLKAVIHINGNNFAGSEDYTGRISLRAYDDAHKDLVDSGILELGSLHKIASPTGTGGSTTSFYEVEIHLSDQNYLNHEMNLEAVFDGNTEKKDTSAFTFTQMIAQQVKVLMKNDEGVWSEETKTADRGESVEVAARIIYTDAAGQKQQEVFVDPSDEEVWSRLTWNIAYSNGSVDGLDTRLDNRLKEKGVLGINNDLSAFGYASSYALSVRASYQDETAQVEGAGQIRIPAVTLKFVNSCNEQQTTIGMLTGNQYAATIKIEVQGVADAGEALKCEISGGGSDSFNIERIVGTHNFKLWAYGEGNIRLTCSMDGVSATDTINVEADKSNVRSAGKELPYYVPKRVSSFFNGTGGSYYDLYGNCFEYKSDTKMTFKGDTYTYKNDVWTRQ